METQTQTQTLTFTQEEIEVLKRWTQNTLFFGYIPTVRHGLTIMATEMMFHVERAAEMYEGQDSDDYSFAHLTFMDLLAELEDTEKVWKGIANKIEKGGEQ